MGFRSIEYCWDRRGGSVQIVMITMIIAMIIFIVIIKVLVGLRRADKGGAGEELDLNIGC